LAAILYALVCVYRRGGCWLVYRRGGGCIVGGVRRRQMPKRHAGCLGAEVARAAQGYELRAQLV